MSKDTGIVNIHGKQYHTVAKRVQDFREANAEYGLLTEVAFREGDLVAVKASIVDKDGRVLATGHAEEDRTKGQVNRTSALENAETSAIGRALSAFGFAGTEFASANEVENAIHQQGEPVELIDGAKVGEIEALADLADVSLDHIRKIAKVEGIDAMTPQQAESTIKKLNLTIDENNQKKEMA